MKVRTYVSMALSMLLAAATASAVSAQGPDAQIGGKDLTNTAAKTNGGDAKGMFFEQLNKSTVSINTGLQYWIELNRGGNSQRVSNKQRFQTGDRIRFHVTANINGFAYVLLKSGSRGERAVLFPDQRNNEDNKVTKGREYVIPGDGFLTFDENPGQEKLVLLLSRQPLDAAAYLDDTESDQSALIASNLDGSKDLIPTKIYVSYGVPHVNPIKKNPPKANPTTVATTTTTTSNHGRDLTPVTLASTTTSTSSHDNDSSNGSTNGAKKTTKTKKDKPKVERTEAQKPERVQKPESVQKPEKVQKPQVASNKRNRKPKPSVTLASTDNDDDNIDDDNTSVTTVVKQDPEGMLHLDVVLEHK